MISFICILLIIFFLMFIAFWFEISSEIKDIKEKDHDIWDKVCHIWNNLPYYSWYGDVRNRIDELENNLTTEIACLATKNNEDIKRVKEGFQKWDVFKFGDDKYVIYHIEQCSDNRKLYKCQNNKGETFKFYDNELISAELIKSASPWLEEDKGR